jgi:hypothetical protein
LRKTILFISLIIITISCKRNSNEVLEKLPRKVYLKNDEKKQLPDDYPVTDNMFYNSTSIQIGKLKTSANWFSNDKFSETLIFELYTDNHRMYTYHFLNKEVNEELKNLVHFDYDGKKNEQKNEIKNHFEDFIKASKKIDKKYFTTLHGIKLGVSKEKILKVLSNPNEKQTVSPFEKFTWGIPTNKTEMYFKENKLIAIIIYKDLI